MEAITPSVDDYPLSGDAVALPVLAALSVVLLLGPVCWHAKKMNLAAAVLIFDLILSNVFVCVNATLWPRDNVDAWWDGDRLCDFEVWWKIFTLVSMSASVTCVLRDLSAIFKVDRLTRGITRLEKVWRFMIIKNGRYNILTIEGCYPALDETWFTFGAIYIWGPLFAMIGCFYAVLTLIRMYRHRGNVSTYIAASNMNRTRFYGILVPCFMSQIVAFSIMLVQAAHYNPDSINFDIVANQQQSDIIFEFSTTTSGLRWRPWATVIGGFVAFFFLGTGCELLAKYSMLLAPIIRPRLLRKLVPIRLYRRIKGALSRNRRHTTYVTMPSDIELAVIVPASLPASSNGAAPDPVVQPIRNANGHVQPDPTISTAVDNPEISRHEEAQSHHDLQASQSLGFEAGHCQRSQDCEELEAAREARAVAVLDARLGDLLMNLGINEN